MMTAPSKPATLGHLIRRLRLKNGWTLAQLGDKVGIPRSTLAKVERDRLTLTYDRLQQMSARLNISMKEFLSPSPTPFAARRSVSLRVNRAPIKAPHGDYEFLCADLRDKRMLPIIARIHARDVAEFGAPLSHAGEEFIFVLDGSIEVHTQFYEPAILCSGQGMYLDGTMAHAYVAKDCDSATLLSICAGADPDLLHPLLRPGIVGDSP
jgi:transcriptional regulator with XRE-family HTH domain